MDARRVCRSRRLSLLQTTCFCDTVVPCIQGISNQHHQACTKTQHNGQAVTMAHVSCGFDREANGQDGLHCVLTTSARVIAVCMVRALGLNFCDAALATLAPSTEEWKLCSSSLQPFLSSPCLSGPLLLLLLTLAHEILRASQPRTPAACALIRLSVSSLEAPVVVKVVRSACHSIITTHISHHFLHHLPSLSS